MAASTLAYDDTERLRELRRYAVLDTPLEEAFDRVTRMAARLLGVPISLVTLMDEKRQWFKSAYGWDKRETPRELSFCAHTIQMEDVMVVADATCDERFSNNALVTGDPRIRAYAGAPLRSEKGFNIGTLCAIDVKPRTFTREEQEILRDLANLVRDALELRLAVRARAVQAAVINNLRFGLVVTDAAQEDDPIMLTNPGFTAMTGYDFEEVVGQNCRLLQGPQTDDAVVDEIRRAVAERRSVDVVLQNYRKDGTAFWNELTVSPVFAETGELIHFVGLQRDITQRKKLEVLRDDLVHMIIHDLRAPLGALTGRLDLLEQSLGAGAPAAQARHLGRAKESAELLQEMITSLLDIKRLEAGEMPIFMENQELGEVVQNAMQTCSGAARGKSIGFQAKATVKVRCDAELTSRVIANLISNALKFTPAEGRVQISVSARGDEAMVSVSDTGRGIPPEFHERIFEKFGQVEARKVRHSTGLGLAFCKLAVQAQGGRIGVHSEPGQGSTFFFSLPAAVAEE